MPGLKLFMSNRLEILVQKLAEELQTPLSAPLKKEVVLVQSKGMERWISMELARYHGICANYRFPFPNTMLDEIFRGFFPDLVEDSPFQPKILAWKIMKHLLDCLTQPGFESLHAYVGKERDSLKCYQISERIAYTFDQYLVFRPDMMLNWEKGKENHWQALLWRTLIRDEKKPHRTALREDFFKKIRTHPPEINNLPERISVFGISSLPPFHMEMFAALSKIIPITLFLMNPCREYWGDIVSDREARKRERKLARKTISTESLYFEKGNSLLASWGTLGKQFFDLVYNFDHDEHECFEEPTKNDLLVFLQSDILTLRERDSDQKQSLSQTDTSVEIHSCHSPMREVEVLYDSMLAMFEDLPELLPKDILVMAPDIEPYTPFIQAVFDTPENEAQKIPHTIADQSIKSESSVIKTFLSILDLEGSRFGASQIMSILELPSIYRRFALEEPDLDVIKRWIDQTGIRWGIDETTREQKGLPSFSENTWRFGLNRLILGYALPAKEEKTFHTILPYDQVEDSSARVLGNFLSFIEKLLSSINSLDRTRALNEWSEELLRILDTFILGDDQTEREILFIRSTINSLALIQEKSGFDKKIELPIIRSYLQKYCEKEGFGFGFMSGGVTFCTMLPMRSIPFKIICLLGMNNDAYPRESRHVSFDLIARHPMPGDRSRRNDDRYLFLEAVLSARQKLYISYVGQSIQDNSIIPPSVVVSELLDYIEQGFAISEKNIKDHLFITHRLQAFSPAYFKKKGRLKSFSKDNYDAALTERGASKNAQPFISRGLSQPDEQFKEIELSSLIKFYANPAKFFLNRRLGIFLEEKTPVLSEREPFDLKGLEKYALEQTLLQKSLANNDLTEYLSAVKASGKIPPGTLGEYLYQKSREEVERFAHTIKPYITETPLNPIEFNLKIADYTLSGQIDTIFESGLIHYRYTKVKIKDRLKIWIYHLVLNSMERAQYPKKSIFIGEDTMVVLFSVPESDKILLNLIKKYWEGLSKPLPFFPEASWEYAHAILGKKMADEEAMRKARDKWEGDDYYRGESHEPSCRLCFGTGDPLNGEFRRIAREIFEPMIKCQEKGSVSSQ
ncbi:MAG: exodeoxyribonuclease V subunit gamma [Thermodesulfobacteriota bacterium]|nr:MAG: exodeoxyribonuclease V subunit gamma [Thermodesulfobacteriota bacterium]